MSYSLPCWLPQALLHICFAAAHPGLVGYVMVMVRVAVVVVVMWWQSLGCSILLPSSCILASSMQPVYHFAGRALLSPPPRPAPGAAAGEERLFVCCNDSTIKVYRLPSMSSATVLHCPCPINYTALSPDGTTLVAVGDCEPTLLYKATPAGVWRALFFGGGGLHARARVSKGQGGV